MEITVTNDRRLHMRSLKCIGLLAAVLLTVFVLPAGASYAGTRIDFSSLDTNQPYKVSGTLYLPENTSSPCPAIVLIHGTVGIDARGALYREPLLNAGIAIFEVNFKTGIYTSALDRPQIETFLPMAFAALKELRKLPAIDPNRIGIMGFSMGGGITLRTAVEANRKMWMGDEKGFVAHAAFYPVCKGFIPKVEHSSGLTGAPMIVFYGTEDVYGEGTSVPELKRLLQKKFKFELITFEYPGATHGFNLNAPPVTYHDPAAKNGKGYMAYDAGATNDSLPKVVDFLRQNLAAK
jgi:dienelactone hydrolase